MGGGGLEDHAYTNPAAAASAPPTIDPSYDATSVVVKAKNTVASAAAVTSSDQVVTTKNCPNKPQITPLFANFVNANGGGNPTKFDFSLLTLPPGHQRQSKKSNAAKKTPTTSSQTVPKQ